jgi:hypothetical protein
MDISLCHRKETIIINYLLADIEILSDIKEKANKTTYMNSETVDSLYQVIINDRLRQLEPTLIN